MRETAGAEIREHIRRSKKCLCGNCKTAICFIGKVKLYRVFQEFKNILQYRETLYFFFINKKWLVSCLVFFKKEVGLVSCGIELTWRKQREFETQRFSSALTFQVLIYIRLVPAKMKK
jgi:hypothetical protein